jgi:hypothetical protein
MWYFVLHVTHIRSIEVATHHLSLRLQDAIVERMERISSQTGRSVSQVVGTALEEWLQMQAYPGIIFRPGPAGRRPALAVGPDIWEVVSVFRGWDERGEEAITRTADFMRLAKSQVSTAIRYYADHGDAIDAWIQRADEEAAEAQATWQREQALLQA